jgi:hypothetical protein
MPTEFNQKKVVYLSEHLATPRHDHKLMKCDFRDVLKEG